MESALETSAASMWACLRFRGGFGGVVPGGRFLRRPIRLVGDADGGCKTCFATGFATDLATVVVAFLAVLRDGWIMEGDAAGRCGTEFATWFREGVVVVAFFMAWGDS